MWFFLTIKARGDSARQSCQGTVVQKQTGIHMGATVIDARLLLAQPYTALPLVPYAHQNGRC